MGNYVLKIAIICLSFVFLPILCANAKGEVEYIKGGYTYRSLQGNVIFAPRGIVKNAILTQDLDLKDANVGQEINATFEDDFNYKQNTIAKAGSIVNGVVTAKKGVKFTRIRTPEGYTIPVSGVLKKPDTEGKIEANEQIEILFDQPITLSAPVGY